MPTRRIDDEEPWDAGFNKPCRHPDHFPPNMRVFEPGNYEHVCPGCGKVSYFTIPERPWLDLAAMSRERRATPRKGRSKTSNAKARTR